MNEEPALSQRQLDLLAIEHAAALAAPLAASGHIFTHAWIDEALALPPQPFGGKPRDSWNLRRAMLIDQWCDALLQIHHIHVENKRGHGYMVIDPKETSRVVAATVRREVKKQLAQAYDKITEASADGLSDRDIRDRHDTLAWIGKIEMVRANQRPRPPKRPQLHAAPSTDSTEDAG